MKVGHLLNLTYTSVFVVLVVAALMMMTSTKATTIPSDNENILDNSNEAKYDGSAILSSRSLPISGPYPTSDPYLFCVYHKDIYPPGNDRMEVELGRWGNGRDFNPTASYRMYHGKKIPGFPQHPHRGFETITATIEGIIDHADSVGNCGRYGHGDLQWMTAGEGIVHSECFPLLNTTTTNPTRFFQIWLNLPKKSKMVQPSFAMFWSNTIPKYSDGTTTSSSTTGKVSATIFIGNDYLGVGKQHDRETNRPPPESWANDPNNDVALIHITIRPGGKFLLPKSHNPSVKRTLFFIETPLSSPSPSSSSEEYTMKIDGKVIDSKKKVSLEMDPTIDNVIMELVPTSSSDDETAVPVPVQEESEEVVVAEFLLLQGRPINEPVAKYGPFVMNTHDEIKQAYADYHKTQFGGWPWPRNDMIFPKSKGRFALVHGKELVPPKNDDNNNNNHNNDDDNNDDDDDGANDVVDESCTVTTTED